HELLHVPLIVFVPGLEGRRVSEIVELVDIVPTLAESLKLAASPRDFDGQSLWASVAGKRAPGRHGAYAEVFEPHEDVTRKSLYTGRWRINWNVENGGLELFDKLQDPGERHDVAAEHPSVVQ